MSTISASTTSTTAYKVTADTTGVLTLQTGATPTTAMTIDGSQNVGIGTSSPSYKLQIGGSVGAGTSPITAYLNQKSNWNSADYEAMQLGLSQLRSVYVSGNNWDLTFQTYAGSFTEKMRIDSSGNLLVGTTSTAFTSSKSFIFDTTSANGYQIINHPTGSATGSAYMYFGYGTGSIGSITQNGTTAVAYNTSSDYRLKENIAPMQGALSVVSQLKPVTYTWKADNSAGQGFIAHELAEVVPDCVTGEKDAVDADGNPVYQGIDTSFLVATLTAAIQELNAKVQALEAQLKG